MRQFLMISFVAPLVAFAAASGQPVPRPTSPAAVAADYMKALQAHDAKAIERLTHDIPREVADIKAKNPQASWQNLINHHYAQVAREAAQRLDDQTIALFTPGATWKITKTQKESNATAVYVTVSYPKIEDSPHNGGQFLDATVFCFTVTASNLVRKITSVGFYRSAVPLMVFTASWTNNYAFHLHATAVGGTPPYSWSAECGGVKFTNQNHLMPHVLGADEALFETMDRLQFDPEPVPCVMTVTDVKGAMDHGHFMVPKIDTPSMRSYCFERSPWLNRGDHAGEMCLGTLLPITTTDN